MASRPESPAARALRLAAEATDEAEVARARYDDAGTDADRETWWSKMQASAAEASQHIEVARACVLTLAGRLEVARHGR